MSNLGFNFALDFSENPFVSFNSKGQGLSRVFDNIWDFTAQGESLKQFGFSAIPEEHRANVQSYLFALITYFKKQDIAHHISVTRMTYWRDCMTYLIKTWRKSEFSLLSRDDEWREAKTRLDGKYSIKSLKSIVSLINKMQEAGLVNRHIEHNQIHKLASDNPERQHIALPTAIHARILEQVINTVETYHPYRHEISDVMQRSLFFRRVYLDEELNRLNITEMNRVEDSRFRRRVRCKIKKAVQHSIPNFEFSVNGDFVRTIADDCLIAVAFFSGARRKELLSMNSESYKEINGVSVLKGLTSKANEGVPVFTTWVSHPLAKKALELAYDMTEYARRDHLQELKNALADGRINNDKYEASKKELESSFISVDMRKKEMKTVNSTYLTTIKSSIYAKRYNISVTEDDVREFNILNPLWDGELKINDSMPNLNLHSLRRSFAVFLVRHRLGDLQTIKYQLKHKNIKMSAWYANFAELARMENILLDSELFDMVEKVNEQIAVDAFDEIYNESETLSGLAGERIMREKDDALKRGEKIIMSRDEITRLVRNNSLSIVLLPTGSYCTNPDCERLCSIETFVSEDKLCEHEIVTDKGAKIIKKHRDRLIDTFRKINDMNDYAYSRILSGYKQKILVMEINLRKHNIDFEYFNDEITGLII